MSLLLAFAVSLFQFANAEVVSREQLSELHTIRNQIKKSVFDKSRFEQDILKSELDIEKQNQDLAQFIEQSKGLKSKIGDRIKNLYKIRRAYPEGSLLTYRSVDDFVRKSYYLKFLNEQDRKLIAEFKTNSQNTIKLKEKIERYKTRLETLKKKSEEKYKSLQAQEAAQREIIRSIREALKTQNKIDSIKTNEGKTFFSEMRGKLPKPSGDLALGDLGIILNRSTNLARLRTGVILRTAANAEVKSVSDGEVVFANNIAGWGPTIIVDHGEFYFSVYSQIKNLSVRLGDQVSSQQKLADVSSLPYHKEGLYFEIRHYSEPEDPRQWFKGE